MSNAVTGLRIGRWEVCDVLARGSFSSVYAARRVTEDPEFPSVAALKILPGGTHTPRQAQHLRELVAGEVELLSRLRGNRLIRMYEVVTVDSPDCAELDGATAVVLELAEGSLDTLLAHTVRPVAGPALLAQVCDGLRHLHHAGWVHGDLKPANVLLMKDGTARLADFNLAAELSGTHAYGPAFATLDYTPPELVWSEVGEHGRTIRPSTDVWAFGVLAHLVLTGTLPLPGGTAAARRDATVRYGRGAEPLRLSPDLPEAWRPIVTDCLARTHEDRAAHDAASLLRRIEAITGGTPAPRLPRLRPLRWRRPALTTALVAAVLGATGMYALWDEEPSYGYHRCPAGSVCFFNGPNGTGEMCSWSGDDPDWLAGARVCGWTRNQPVRSIFNNNQERSERHDVAYYRGTGFVPAGHDTTRPSKRAGCTSVNQQGNLHGTYAPASHRWVERC
ncbi:serine/threonine-protein kinase [Prauserella cavernicola]|uniref:Protein kinase n=1 Tax=Prauserella cavernicola TaxID=2800127 RepID=A0A934V8B6_9PSEU|nr:serine/threonine-protein kinase [Prauserella cavernicola]MBK1787573.1 protein kinase [Prauserella cavernicola]